MSSFMVSTGFGKRGRPRKRGLWINKSVRRHNSKPQSNIDNMLDKARKIFEIGSFSNDSPAEDSADGDFPGK
jgi:hypothetical protein